MTDVPDQQLANTRVKSELQKKLRQMKNDWSTKKAAEIQGLSDRSDSKDFFASLREVYGPQGTCLDPVKSTDNNVLHTNKNAIMERWREHLSLQLNPRINVSANVNRIIPQLLIRHHLDEPPSIVELDMTIKRLKCGKATGPDGIPPEVWKHGKQNLKANCLNFSAASGQQRKRFNKISKMQ